MPIEITGFDNYSDEVIDSLRGLFAEEKIKSHPIKHGGVIIWLDAAGAIHRDGGLPAIERSDGSCEYWIHGKKRK